MNCPFLSAIICMFSVFLSMHLYGQGIEPSKEDLIFRDLTGIIKEKREESLRYVKIKRPAVLLPRIAGAVISSGSGSDRLIYMEAMKFYPFRESLDYWVDILERSESFILKIEVMEYISSEGGRSVVVPIANQLKSPFITVRKAAARLLERVGDDRVYPIILTMINDENPVMKIHAVEALFYLYDFRFYQNLIKLLDDGSKSVRIYTLRCLRQNRVDKSLYLVRKLALYDSDPEVRLTAIDFLGDYGELSSVYVLLKTVDDGNRDIRYGSVQSLYRINSSRASYTLCSRLSVEDDDEIKGAIMDALARNGSIPVIAGLKKILESEDNFRLRIKAAWTLGFLRDDSSMNVLIDALKDREYRVRAEACNSLGNYRSSKAKDALVDAVGRETSRYVRSAALYAILAGNTREATVRLFDIYSKEKDSVFRGQLYAVIRELIVRYH